jgi:hypothetical protein
VSRSCLGKKNRIIYFQRVQLGFENLASFKVHKNEENCKTAYFTTERKMFGVIRTYAARDVSKIAKPDNKPITADFRP